jgi:hypothetical protein
LDFRFILNDMKVENWRLKMNNKEVSVVKKSKREALKKREGEASALQQWLRLW